MVLCGNRADVEVSILLDPNLIGAHESQCPDLSWEMDARCFLVRSIFELFIGGGRSYNIAFLS